VNRATRLANAAQDKTKPKGLRLACAVAFLYVILPLDFLPDLMPVVGWIDDILVVLSAIAWIVHQRSKILPARSQNQKDS
jgi:uncharacterized membrane protein YkvA (DUF1232 family)